MIKEQLWSKGLMMLEEFVEIGVFQALVILETIEGCTCESF